jgi:hypothetical protein
MPGCWVDNTIRYRGVKSELSIFSMQKNTDQNMLVPMSVTGTKDTLGIYKEYEWIKKLPDKKIYLSLFQRHSPTDLPQGYEYYIVSFHLEAVDLVWLKKQQTNAPIIVLFDGNHYDCQIPNVHFVPYMYWHAQLDRIIEWFGIQSKSYPTYKFSAICNRITQSKVWITTKLLETARSTSIIRLSSWLESKNVHDWQLTGNDTLDDLTKIFKNKYHGTEITIDSFDNQRHNVQKITADPWQPYLQDSVINFTNESFHYSLMYEDGVSYVWPGPFITEKTLKCLIAGTAFIPVGQFETYKTLQQHGLNFDYGFDTQWDLDAGALTRSQKIIELIDYLNELSVDELVRMTRESNEHNQNHIVSGLFAKSCRDHNKGSLEQIFSIIS